MLQRFNKNNEVLKIMGSEGYVKNETLLLARKWEVLKNLEEILSDFYYLTLFLESDKSYLSQVLPTISLLLKIVSKNPENETYEMQSFKKEIKNSLNKRFAGYEEKELFMFSTILDPRFKTFGIRDKKLEKSMTKKLESILDEKVEISDKTLVELREAGLNTQKLRLTEMFGEFKESEECKLRNKMIKNQVLFY